MGKRTKESETASKDDSKRLKKQKQAGSSNEEIPVFNLFGKTKDAELDDIFSKGVCTSIIITYVD
jgi:hypothetical protein